MSASQSSTVGIGEFGDADVRTMAEARMMLFSATVKPGLGDAQARLTAVWAKVRACGGKRCQGNVLRMADVPPHLTDELTRATREFHDIRSYYVNDREGRAIFFRRRWVNASLWPGRMRELHQLEGTEEGRATRAWFEDFAELERRELAEPWSGEAEECFHALKMRRRELMRTYYAAPPVEEEGEDDIIDAVDLDKVGDVGMLPL